MKAFIAFLLVASMLLIGCSTLVNIETNPADATVKVNGKSGKSQSLSDTSWTEYEVVVEKEGYRTYHGQLRKEIKIGAFIAGLLLGYWPWIWAYGPASYQYFELQPLQ